MGFTDHGPECGCDACCKRDANPKCWRCSGRGTYFDDLPEEVICDCVITKRRKNKWDRLVAEADRLLLTDPEKLPAEERAMWYQGSKQLLEDLRKGEP